MRTIAESVYRDAAIGTPTELPKAGTALENRYVFDSSAREIKAMAERGLVKIISESHSSEPEATMITGLAFVKVH